MQDRFLIDLNPYDVIIGYRADDSYFSFAQDFVAGSISLSKLKEAMYLGKLGEQTVFKSKISFSHLNVIKAQSVDASIYFEKKKNRDTKVRYEYRKTRSSSDSINDLFMLDIMREEIKNDDPRLR
ncbi:MAG: DUF3990 domain-containing protein [Succinivibrio sp.]|nr:DUF3990 domain-containing protein [Succinivibrio sp.]